MILLLLAGLSGCAYPTDWDADGVEAPEDCDDIDAARAPGLAERCDGIDNDCDGLVDDTDPDVDESDFARGWLDADGDGRGDDAAPWSGCDAPSNLVSQAGDCDDNDPTLSPDQPEVCDGIDNDCDELVDAEDDSIAATELVTGYVDDDRDGYGDEGAPVSACALGEGQVTVSGDCDDEDPSVHPGQEEICGDDVDNDCVDDASMCVRLSGLLGVDDMDASWLGQYEADAGGNGDQLGWFVGFGRGIGVGDTDVALIVASHEDGTTNGADTGKVFIVTPESGVSDVVLGAAEVGEAGLQGFIEGPGSGHLDHALGFNEGADSGLVVMVSTGEDAGAYFFDVPITGDVAIKASDEPVLDGAGSWGPGPLALVHGWESGDGTLGLVSAASANPCGTNAEVALRVLPDLADTETEAIYGAKVPGGVCAFPTVAAADLDGDGIEDLALGAYTAKATKEKASKETDEVGPGRVYLVQGGYGSSSGSLDDAWRILEGPTQGSHAGAALATADVDADGALDLAVGAPGVHPYTYAYGQVSVITQDSLDEAGAATVVELVDASSVQLHAISEQYLGLTLAGGGDLDLDGTDDLLLGTAANVAVVAYGPLSPDAVGHDVELDGSDLNLLVIENDVTTCGTSSSWFGFGLAIGGDTDGDGNAELLVGDPCYPESGAGLAGAAFWLEGRAQGQ